MKKACTMIVFCLSFCTLVLTQEDITVGNEMLVSSFPRKYSGNFSQDYIDSMIFRGFDKSTCTTNFLVDFNTTFGDSLLVFDGLTFNDTINVYDWLTMYKQFRNSSFQKQNFIEIGELISNITNSYDNGNHETVTIPIGVLFNDVNYLENFDLLTQFNITEDRAIIPNSQNVESKTLFLATPLIDNSNYEKIKFVLDAEFVNSNNTNFSIYVDYGDGFLLLNNENELTFTPINGTNVIKIKLIDSNNQTYESIGKMNVFFQKQKDSGTSNKSIFDEKEKIHHSGVKMRYATVYGCDNESYKKPVIIFPGFQPQPLNGFNSLSSFYDKMNFHGFLDDLVTSKHDIIIVKFAPGNGDLVIESELVELLIEEINQNKIGDYESTIFGLSAGGQAVKMALNRMEKNHFENNGNHHHCKMYVSFDSPHKGAEIPVADQFASYDNFNFNLPIGPSHAASLMLSRLLAYNVVHNVNAAGGKQLLRYHTDDAVGGSLDGCSNLRTEFMTLMNSYDHTRTQVHGYPSFSRNIAVSLGSHKTYQDGDGTAGQKLFQKTSFAINPLGYCRDKQETWSSEYTTNHTVYKREYERHFLVWYTGEFYSKKTDNTYELDFVPGGLRNIMHLVSNDAMRVKMPTGFGNSDYNGNMSHVSPLSSLDIRQDLWPSSAYLNLQDFGLMFINPSDVIEPKLFNNYMGYPRIGFNSNHFNITPFEAIYSEDKNMKHIVPDWDEAEASVQLKHFLLNEIEPWYLPLQNYRLGYNARNNYRYKAKYFALYDISVGEYVTERTDQGSYIVESNGDLEIMSAATISIKSGFHVKSGGTMHAFIGEEGCEKRNNSSSNDEESNQSSNNQTQNINFSVEIDSIAKMIVYPNPTCNKNFTIQLMHTSAQINAFYQLVSLTGLVLESGIFTGTDNLVKTNLEKGNYILYVETQDGKHYSQLILIDE